jgi:hypothetical protein
MVRRLEALEDSKAEGGGEVKTDICANRHGGNAESVAANWKTNKQLDAERIMKLLGCHNDLTCQEASDILRMPYTTASARFSDLKRAGRIEPTERRKTRSGRFAMAWRKVKR